MSEYLNIYSFVFLFLIKFFLNKKNEAIFVYKFLIIIYSSKNKFKRKIAYRREKLSPSPFFKSIEQNLQTKFQWYPRVHSVTIVTNDLFHFPILGYLWNSVYRTDFSWSVKKLWRGQFFFSDVFKFLGSCKIIWEIKNLDEYLQDVGKFLAEKQMFFVRHNVVFFDTKIFKKLLHIRIVYLTKGIS